LSDRITLLIIDVAVKGDGYLLFVSASAKDEYPANIDIDLGDAIGSFELEFHILGGSITPAILPPLYHIILDGDIAVMDSAVELRGWQVTVELIKSAGENIGIHGGVLWKGEC